MIRDDLHNSSYFNYYSNSVANNIPLKGSVCFYKDGGVNAQRKEKEEEVVYRSYLFYYTLQDWETVMQFVVFFWSGWLI